MRVVFLSHYFPPEVNAPAVRTYEHCREWARAGHDIHVVTCVPSHPQGQVYPGYRRQLGVQHEQMDGIHVHRVWTFITPNKGRLRRTLGYVSYMLSAVWAALRLPRPDVLVATSPQFFCAGAGFFASRLLRRPWVFELRDIWPASIAAVGAARNKTLMALLEKMELALYRDADAVVALTEAFRRNLIDRGIPSAKIHVITNGIAPDFRRAVGRAAARKQLGLDGKFIVSYVGTHGMAHHLETLLATADLLRGEPDIQFLTVGDGAAREKLLRLKRETGLDNVRMIPQVSRPQAKRYLEASDVSAVLLRKAEVFKTVIPSKLLEAMAVGNPLVLGVEGEARRIVEEAGAGICVEPESARQFADAVLRLRSDPELRALLGRNGAVAVRRNFRRTALARKMWEVIQTISPGAW